ncbi:magnesium-dependent phosphatase-1 [Mycena galericulata]|nr:magnesium-dependent phosphatase-1 [Mycena galericulata]
MFPKVIALDTDGTLFAGQLDQKQWGKGPNAKPKLADNIHNHQHEIRMSADIPRIVNDILKNGASLAIVSRNTSKVLCDRALHYFKADDPKDGEKKSIIKLVLYDEVVDEPKTEHFKRIHKWSKHDYSDMVLFDDESANNIVQDELVQGVHVVNCFPEKGLTWEIYEQGIERWRKEKSKK